MITAMQFSRTTRFTLSIIFLMGFIWLAQATPLTNEKGFYTQQGDITGNINNSQYHYNPLNQLITDKTQHTILSYQYYADDLQATEQVNSQTTRYRYYAVGTHLLNQLQNNAFTGYLTVNHSVLVWHHITLHHALIHMMMTNRHQSVILTLQPEYITPQQYTAYGIAILPHLGSNPPFTYSHYLADQAARMDDLKARFYLPHIRTFLTRDSKNLNNRYQYANNNPVMNIDPSGHMTEALFNQMEAILQTTDHALNAEIRVVRSFDQEDTVLRNDRFAKLQEAAENKWITTGGKHTTIISAHGNDTSLFFHMKLSLPQSETNDVSTLSQSLRNEGFLKGADYSINTKDKTFAFNGKRLLQQYLEHKLGPTECLVFDACYLGTTTKFISLQWPSGPTEMLASPDPTYGIYSLSNFSAEYLTNDGMEKATWRSSQYPEKIAEDTPLVWSTSPAFAMLPSNFRGIQWSTLVDTEFDSDSDSEST